MSITVTEKEHWKERIAQKIERAIKELVEKNDPQFIERITRQARDLAIESLGGTQHVDDLAELEEKQLQLRTDIEHFQGRLAELAKKAGVKPKPYYYNSRDDIGLWNDAVTFRQESAEKELLSKEPLGQRILKLRGEQEALLDTVWLSTSAVQIRELWRNVTELVSGELSELQKKVLARPAIEEDAK
jgi:hypothetical protein